MRILHLIHSMDPRDGGPPEVVRQLAQVAMETGDSVEIACQDDPSESFLETLPGTVHPLGPSSGKYGHSKKLVTWLDRNAERFDGLIIHGVWQYVTLAGSRAAHGRVPYFVFVHGALDPWFKRQYPLKHAKKCLYWPLLYPVLSKASAMLFTGNQELELAKESFWPHEWRSRIVPLGIQPPGGDPFLQTEAFYSMVPAVRNRRFLLFMARIHEKKGCDLLIQAFAKLGVMHPDVHLVMAGQDQVGLQAQLEQMVAQAGLTDRVHWPGMLKGDVKQGAYLACEALVLPSHQENFGISVAECLASGKPVLISNKVEIAPMIAQDGAGLVEDDTLEGTKRLLTAWLAMSQDQRDAMSACARPCFDAHFSISMSARMLHEIVWESAGRSSEAESSRIALHSSNTEGDVHVQRDA